MFQPDFASADRKTNRWQDYVVPQDWGHFTPAEHRVWDTLFARQVPYLGTRIVSPFLAGIPTLGLDSPGIPELGALNARLTPLSRWELVSVAGIVPDAAFFAMLSERKFPIGNFIRSVDSLDYLEEPDCFHDIFGHVPMLADPAIGRLMEALGRLGVEAIAAGEGDAIARLYWHSVEFGLAREGGEVKILGAGLASSFGEAHVALEADLPRPHFTLRDAGNTPYRNDRFQPLYFVADSLEELAAELEALDVAGLKALSGPL
ncbi:MAG: phenylalanine 4-monooxygenase [Sphingomonas bacterium]|nr:phenylalanine 4-monooxygenase [Sphingomonas bacterium]